MPRATPRPRPRRNQARARKRRRKSNFRPVHYAATRIQRVWRAGSHQRTCVIRRVYVPRDERVRIDGHVFARESIRGYIYETGDLRHPVTRAPIPRDTLAAIGISERFAKRRRRAYLREVEERASMHTMVMDEFKEALHASGFAFGTFMIFVRAYSNLLEEQRVDFRCHFSTLYDEIHNFCSARGTGNSEMYDRIARAILIPE